MSHSGGLFHLSFLFLLEFAFVSSVEVNIPEGSGLTLTCYHEKAPRVSDASFRWSFRPLRDPIASSLSDDWIPLGTQHRLSKQHIHKTDEGEYECITDGYLGENRVKIRRTYKVTVDNSASFQLWTVITVTEGDTTYLPCSPTNRSWVNNGAWLRQTIGGSLKRLEPLEKTSDEQDDGVFWAVPMEDLSITIYNVKLNDSGMYHCQCQDGSKTESQLVELIVEALPPPRCFGYTDPWEVCEEDRSRTAGAILGESLTDFATKIYAQLRQAKPTGNLLFSPLSLAGVLSHLLLGARDETRTLMEDALSLPRGFSCTHQTMKDLKEQTQESLEMASNIFYSPDRNVSESFVNQSMEFYEAAPIKLTEDHEQSINMINEWVAEKTRHRITNLMDSMDASQLILLNTVYFLGKWKQPFDGNRFGSFTTLNGDMAKVPILYKAKYKLSMKFFNSLRAQVAAFPLTGQNRMLILVPTTPALKDLQAMEDRMTDTVMREIAEGMDKVTPTVAEVTLPKLKMDISTDMNRLLGDIGLGQLFVDPNLCGVFPEASDMALSDAKHRASLTLSESGVEAAAASSLSFARSFPSFSALQPFVLVLWSDQAKCPLFMGRVTRP